MFETITAAQWLSAGSNILGQAAGGAAAKPPSGPSSANAANSYWFDSSGWTVGTQGAKVAASATKNDIPWPWIIGAGLVGLLIWKKA